ncbi:MAG: type 4a pilus biogenesis protein PilO [bacterium]
MSIKNKINLSVAAFFVFALLAVVFLILPLCGEIKSNSQAKVVQKGELAALNEEIENLKAFKNIYIEIKPNLEKIDNLFVSSKIPIGFISFLEAICGDSQIEINISSFSSASASQELWPFLIFQINFTGAFSDFTTFLEKLEASPYLVEVQNLNIKSLNEEKGVGSDNVMVTFSIKVYAR